MKTKSSSICWPVQMFTPFKFNCECLHKSWEASLALHHDYSFEVCSKKQEETHKSFPFNWINYFNGYSMLDLCTQPCLFSLFALLSVHLANSLFIEPESLISGVRWRWWEVGSISGNVNVFLSFAITCRPVFHHPRRRFHLTLDILIFSMA